MPYTEEQRELVIDYLVTDEEPMTLPYTGGKQMVPTNVRVRYVDRKLSAVWVNGQAIGVKGQVTKKPASTPMPIDGPEDLDEPEVPAWLKAMVLESLGDKA